MCKMYISEYLIELIPSEVWWSIQTSKPGKSNTYVELQRLDDYLIENYFNKVLCYVVFVFLRKNVQILLFQLLKWEYFLAFLFLYDHKLNIFGLWTFGLYHRLINKFYYFIEQTTNQLTEKIINILINDKNNKR